MRLRDATVHGSSYLPAGASAPLCAPLPPAAPRSFGVELDVNILADALAPTLTEEEAIRNSHGDELLFANSKTALGKLCVPAVGDSSCKPVQLLATHPDSPSFQGKVQHASNARCAHPGGILLAPPGGHDFGLNAVMALASVGGVFTP